MKKLRRKGKFLGLAALAAGAAISATTFIPQSIQADTVISIPWGTQPEYRTEEKTITRTAHFLYDNGNGTQTPVMSTKGEPLTYSASRKITRTAIYDKNTGKLLGAADWGDITFEFPEWECPKINGYVSNISTIPAKSANGNDEDEDIYVYYSKKAASMPAFEEKTIERNINYLYEDGKPILDASGKPLKTVQSAYFKRNAGNAWPSVTWNEYKVSEIEGYTPSISVIPAVTFTPDNPPKDVNVYFKLNEEKYTSADKTVERTIRYYTVSDNGTKSYAGYYKDSVKFPAGISKTATYTFDDYTVPERKGYTPDRTVVKGRTVTPASDSFTEDVVYKKTSGNNEGGADTGTDTRIKTETKTVERNIKYVLKYSDGSEQTYGSARNTATFSRTGKENNMPAWKSQTFAAVTVPSVKGFEPDTKTIPAVTFTPDNPPKDITVYYSQLPTKTESKTVKRTIRFIGKKTDGSEVSLGSATQSVTLYRTVYTDSNGKTQVLTDWSKSSFRAYAVPEKAGYTRTQNTVPSMEVNANSQDSELKVYYNQVKQGFVEENGSIYYYSNGNKLTGNQSINGIKYTFDGSGRLISEPFNVSVGRGARPLVNLSSGWYTISTSANKNFVLDINGASTLNSANLQIYKSNGSKAQKFYIKALGNNEYVIYTGTNSLRSVVDVAGNKTASGTNVQQYRYNGSVAQIWKIVANTDGSVSFIAKNTGFALDVSGGVYANKRNVQMYKVNYTRAQNFTLTGVTAP